jgi:arsenate reductase-like glutaredoxin family protein
MKTAMDKIKNTDDPIDQATLQKLVDNNGKGHARAFISGQATAYRRAAEMLEALYELPF